MRRTDKLLPLLVALLVLALVVLAHAQQQQQLPDLAARGIRNRARKGASPPSTTQLATDWLRHCTKAMNFVMNMLFTNHNNDDDNGDDDWDTNGNGGISFASGFAASRRLRAQLTGLNQPQARQSLGHQKRRFSQGMRNGDAAFQMERVRYREATLRSFLESYDFNLDLSDAEIRSRAIEQERNSAFLESLETSADAAADEDETFCQPGLYLRYPSTKYTCNGVQVTLAEYVILSQNTSNNCTSKQSTAHSCLCPEDRTGARCQGFRSFECSAPLETPIKNCTTPQDNGLRLDGDFSCLRFTKQDVLDFSFNLACNFTEPLQNNEQNLDPAINYTVVGINGTTFTLAQLKNMIVYFASSDHFKLSYQLWQPFQLKFFALNSLSNNEHVWSIDPTPQQWTSNSLIEISGVNLGTIAEDRKFVTGGRLYAEAGWRMTWSFAGFFTMRTERLFIDLTDEEEPRRSFQQGLRIALYITVPTLIALIVGTAGSVYLFVRLYKRHQRRKEEIAASLSSQPEQRWLLPSRQDNDHTNNNNNTDDDDQ